MISINTAFNKVILSLFFVLFIFNIAYSYHNTPDIKDPVHIINDYNNDDDEDNLRDIIIEDSDHSAHLSSLSYGNTLANRQEFYLYFYGYNLLEPFLIDEPMEEDHILSPNIPENQKNDEDLDDKTDKKTPVPKKEAPAADETNTINDGKSEKEPEYKYQDSLEGSVPGKKSFNQLVLDMIWTYQGGKYPYLLNNDYANYNGVTTNIFYKDNLFLRAHPSGNRANHCVGITFEVFFNAMMAWNKQEGLPAGTIKELEFDELYDFMLLWYVAAGPKEVSNITVAVEKYELGHKINNFEDARAGDFIDISRENNTGHTAVFIEWIREQGRIVGVKYWSSQNSTRGIGYNKEYFNIKRHNGSKYGIVRIDQVYLARVTP